MIRINTKFCTDFRDIQNKFDLDKSNLNDISLGYNGNIYLLYDRCIDKKKNPKEYRSVVICPDWQNGGVNSIDLLYLGEHDIMYPIIQPIGENLLLLGRRCWCHRDGNADNNAIIVNKNSEIVREFCLGDGIEQCIVTSDNRIITSYFDEGVFGNNGWNYPIGSSGLIIWNEHGEKIWENKTYPIYDCYAINVDDSEKLWFYYYDEFNVVCCDENKDDTVYDPKISGSNFMMISKNCDALIMNCGYDSNSDFKLIELGFDGKCTGNTTEFVYQNKPLLISETGFYSNRAVFCAKETLSNFGYGLYIAEF